MSSWRNGTEKTVHVIGITRLKEDAELHPNVHFLNPVVCGNRLDYFSTRATSSPPS